MLAKHLMSRKIRWMKKLIQYGQIEDGGISIVRKEVWCWGDNDVDMIGMLVVKTLLVIVLDEMYHHEW